MNQSINSMVDKQDSLSDMSTVQSNEGFAFGACDASENFPIGNSFDVEEPTQEEIDNEYNHCRRCDKVIPSGMGLTHCDGCHQYLDDYKIDEFGFSQDPTLDN
jgi:hypothetical protein